MDRKVANICADVAAVEEWLHRGAVVGDARQREEEKNHG